MDRFNRLVLNVIFCLQVLLIFLLFIEDRIELPVWLQVFGRMHPLVLHLPIGVIVFVAILIIFQKQFDKNLLQPVIHLALVITSLSATCAALFGFFLSIQGDYGQDALFPHKVSRVVLSCLCYIVLLWYHYKKQVNVFIGLGIVACVMLVFAGHTGSVLTHGDNFILGPGTGPEIVLTAENASVYEFAVEPILERKCFSCHNEAKAKGKLIMTSPEKFAAGGEHGKPWVEGKPSESRIIKSFLLPLSDDNHMPPDGKPQLTQIEINTLQAWIRAGANFDKKLNDFVEGDSLKLIVASLAATQQGQVEQEVFSFPAADEAVIKKLNTPFRTVFPIYQNSPALQADFFVAKAYESKSLEELKEIADQLVIVNLSKMPVIDKELSVIKSFKNLRQLNLNFSLITGNGLKELKDLKNLRSLSISGTKINAKDIENLLTLPELKELFVWGTDVTESDQKDLEGKYPKVLIRTSDFNDESVLKLSRPMLVNEGVMKKNDDIVLRHPMPGVAIRYTLDGSVPDTTKGLLYDKPFRFAKTTSLKAIACKDKWYCSEAIAVTCFIEDLKPTNIELLTTPDKDYPGEGAKGLIDGKKGLIDIMREASWLGYRHDPFTSVFEFDNDQEILTEITLSYGKNLGAYIFPPQEIELYAGDSKDKLSLIAKINVEQPIGNEPSGIQALHVKTDGLKHKVYKLIAKPVPSLPKWHNNKGEKGWFFIDEIFFSGGVDENTVGAK